MLPRYTRQIKAFKLPRPKKFFTLLCLVKPTLCSLIPISALTYQDYAANGAGQPGAAAASQPQKTNRDWCCSVGQARKAAANLQKKTRLVLPRRAGGRSSSQPPKHKPRLVLLRRAGEWSRSQPHKKNATSAPSPGRGRKSGQTQKPKTNRDWCCSVGQGGRAAANLQNTTATGAAPSGREGGAAANLQNTTATGAAPSGRGGGGSPPPSKKKPGGEWGRQHA